MVFNVEIKTIETGKIIKKYKSKISTIEELIALYQAYAVAPGYGSCILADCKGEHYVFISVCEQFPEK